MSIRGDDLRCDHRHSARGAEASLSELGFEMGKRGLVLTRLGRPKTRPLDSVFGRQLAHTFVELGPTFIKLGQMLASRRDIVGEPVADELRCLFDSVPPIPFRKIRRILESELRRNTVKKNFSAIETKALGSASLAQTHRATLTNKEDVILKVQKPGVEKIVRADLFILEGLARSVHILLPKLQLLALFQDFKQATLREIDYREEAKNIDRFLKNNSSVFTKSSVAFPNYVPELTTAHVITLEPMHGVKLSTLKKGTTVARKAAAKSLEAILEQIFDHGFFHADPHAGNLFFLEDSGGIGFIDLGLVGQLEPDDKRRFLKVLFAILKRDRRGLAKSLYALGQASPKTDPARFEAKVDKLLNDVKAQGLDKTSVESMVSRLLTIARSEGIFIPNRYVMLLRSCLIIEGVAKELDPGLSIAAVATPIVARSLFKSFNPLRLFRRS
ncbi:MAG: AarF/ABC1/UbiB kinase family protein [Deltaproteobacteria bacterium]|nr:AarF/ABC1/UbiB kinase family protein [Deltaproteobacteria bacterium]